MSVLLCSFAFRLCLIFLLVGSAMFVECVLFVCLPLRVFSVYLTVCRCVFVYAWLLFVCLLCDCVLLRYDRCCCLFWMLTCCCCCCCVWGVGFCLLRCLFVGLCWLLIVGLLLVSVVVLGLSAFVVFMSCLLFGCCCCFFLV